MQPDGTTPVMSRQDWSELCDAADTTTEETCPFPQARAFDHNDQGISVRERVFVHQENGDDMEIDRTQVDFAQPSMLLFKFDAQDAAGNHAEQVVFALILQDTVAPEIVVSPCADGPNLYDSSDGVNAAAAKSCTFEAGTDHQVYTVESNTPTDDEEFWKLPRATAKDNCGVNGNGVMQCRANQNSWTDISDDERYCVHKCTRAYPLSCDPSALTSCQGEAATFVESDDQTIDQALTTEQEGRYQVFIGVEDTAGDFGANNADNTVESVIDVTFEDNTRPTITVQGALPDYVQCDHTATYTDSSNGAGNPAVSMWDNLATQAELAAALQTDLSDVNMGIPDDYWVTYSVSDGHGNDAEGCLEEATATSEGPVNCGARRKVEVRDDTPPSLEYADGEDRVVYLVGSVHDIDDIDAGVTPSDQCDEFIGEREITVAWESYPENMTSWEPNAIGTWERRYTVCDATTHCTNITRTFVGQDRTAPIIKEIGPKNVVINAKSTNADYEDDGAQCHDYVDGIYAAEVTESGDEVDTKTPGVYHVIYGCQDLSGNNATAVTRTVTVQDVDCPTIELEGDAVMTLQAGQTWVDPGWTTTDDIDGDLSDRCTADELNTDPASEHYGKYSGCTEVIGDNINENAAFTSHESCSEIKYFQQGDVELTSGEYYITKFVAATESFARVKVFCDMDTQDDTGFAPGYTYYECKGCTAVEPYTADEAGDCADYGMVMAQFDTSLGLPDFRDNLQWLGAEEMLGSQYFVNAGISSTNYLCSTNDHKDQDQMHLSTQGALAHSITHGSVHANEEGKYIVTYKARDRSYVAQCGVKTRTVVVRDTWKPVITLHRNGELIQYGSVDDPANPAGSPNSNPFLRDSLLSQASVDSTSNGWFLGAAAAAISGIAMLGYSARSRPAMPVSVPV
jgi:hypothetical protein